MQNAEAATVPARVPLSGKLRNLTLQFQDRPVRFGEVVATMQGRSYDLFLILITLPFITPIPLPLLSTPIGLMVVLAGSRLALGQRPWWPQRLLRHELPAQFMTRLLTAATRVLRVLEYLVKPRLAIFHRAVLFQRVSGLLIAGAGLLLLLPIPVPFTNSLPALTVLLLATGALEEDGLFFLAGGGMFLLAVGYFILLAVGGTEVVHEAWQWMRP
jgi:hypothetical protein